MLDYYEFIDRLERLPANEVIRSIRIQSEAAAPASACRPTHALSYLRHLVDRWATRCDVTEYQVPSIVTGDHRADALLESIETSEVDVRFVPDWADVPFKSPA